MQSPRISHRWWAAGAAVVGVTAVAVPVATVFAAGDDSSPRDEIADCEVEVLTGPDGESAKGIATAVSDDGQYVAGTVDGFAALWQDGEYREIGPEYHVVDVNSNGEVAVTLSEGEGSSFGIWRDGEYAPLEASHAETEVELAAINDNGDVIGNTDQGEMDETTTPLRWKSGETEAEELELSGDYHGVVTDISANGEVIGNQYINGDLDDERIPWIWDAEGNGSQLTTEFDYGLGIAGSWTVLATKDDETARWQHGTDEEAEALDFRRHSVHDIDDAGWVYGVMDEGDDVVAAAQGYDEAMPLPRPEDSGDSAVYASSVDGSRLAGEAQADGNTVPVAWNCI